jgi:hypothetical protein
MTLSPYFRDLVPSYEAEIDDLTTDSEGRDVLQRRLADKRAGFASLLALMDTDPLLLAPAFHGAFGFGADRLPAIEAVLAGEFGDFPPWSLVCERVDVAPWARPLVAQALAEPLGEEFLALTVGLEYALSRQRGASGPGGAADAADAADGTDAGRGRGEGDDDRGDRGDQSDDGADDGDGESLGEDFLEQQGFDRRTPR